MKRILTMFFAVLLLSATVFGMSVSADSAMISAGKLSDVKPNETFELPLTLSGNPGVWYINFNVKYDKATFTLTDIKKDGTVFAESEITVSPIDNDFFTFTGGSNELENITKNGKLVTLVFKVNSAATNGKYSFDVAMNSDPGNIINKDGNEVTIATSGSSVSVTGGAKATSAGATVAATYATKAVVTDANGNIITEATKAAVELGGNSNSNSQADNSSSSKNGLLIVIIILIVAAVAVIAVYAFSRAKKPAAPEKAATPETTPKENTESETEASSQNDDDKKNSD